MCCTRSKMCEHTTALGFSFTEAHWHSAQVHQPGSVNRHVKLQSSCQRVWEESHEQHAMRALNAAHNMSVSFRPRLVVDITHQHSTHRSTQCTHLHSSLQRQSVFVFASRFLDHSETRTAFSLGSRKRVASHGSGAQDSDDRRKP